ncbi:D-alanine--poly(phosphoribitol) ligase subunit DltA [Enterococcus sp. HY326]|uniref:D-alanine--poly(phosphoribitol) ligase subunit DltA n=1 Tax=Enterococcus sp. HY326 TaxID=2971265 RepID=UPI00223EA322|nr:D-alanine--poly(phosphoribitol) ligase subunit DltA [Enterococcus sp. HY326]
MLTNIVTTIDSYGVTDPQRIAYRDETSQFTYGQLKKYSDQVATFLTSKIKAAGPIVVYGELEFEMLAAFLGISKTGRAYIPIESNTPQERVELILQVAKPAAILAVADWAGPAINEIPIISPLELQAIFENEAEVKDFSIVKPDDTYYIIFTSGTTGVPKGVQISHKNLLSFVNWELTDFDLPEGASFLSQAPYSFDLSVMGIYPALTSGGSLVPMKKETINDFRSLFSTLPKLDINVWISTPSFMKICLMEPTFDGQHVPSLQTFLFCGEELPKSTALELLIRFPQAKIFNTYGPTEATVAVSGVEITSELLEKYERVPIGYVKEDTQILFMEEGRVLENGAVGEIVIVGPSVSKGYLNNPEKTAAAFFEYGGVPAYHTGDSGSMTKEGLLLYEGRIDFQVKFHGYRIELEDIDHHLDDVSLVKQATVVPKYVENKVEQLIAYVVPEANDFEKEFKLTKAIKEELAGLVMDYMVPQKFIYVEELPLTANGKVDRKGLIAEANR